MRRARIVILDVSGGLPAIPGTWQREDNGWFTLQGGAAGAFAAVNIVAASGTGQFLGVLFCADVAALAPLLAAVIRSWASLAALFADNVALANAVKTRWPWWRVTGTDGGSPIVSELRQLTTPLPTLTPSGGAPLVDGALSITSLDALAFPRSLAGWQDDADAATGGP